MAKQPKFYVVWHGRNNDNLCKLCFIKVIKGIKLNKNIGLEILNLIKIDLK